MVVRSNKLPAEPSLPSAHRRSCSHDTLGLAWQLVPLFWKAAEEPPWIGPERMTPGLKTNRPGLLAPRLERNTLVEPET